MASDTVEASCISGVLINCTLDYGDALQTKKGALIIIDGCTSGMSAKLYCESYTCKCVLKLQPSDQNKNNILQDSITYIILPSLIHKSTNLYFSLSSACVSVLTIIKFDQTYIMKSYF